MSVLVYISVLSIAVCHVAAFRHEKRQTAGDQDASALCCYPPKYAWKRYETRGYIRTFVNKDGTVETDEFMSGNSTNPTFIIFDGERVYWGCEICALGIVFLITPTSQYGGEAYQYLRVEREGGCFEIENLTYTRSFHDPLKCFEGEYAGIQEMNGNRYNVYHNYDPIADYESKLYATRDVNGDCIPQLRVMTSKGRIAYPGRGRTETYVNFNNYTYVQADFGPQEERLVDPPASEMCPPS